MADLGRNVLLLAGRLGTHDQGGPITAFLDRLARRGVAARVVCLAGGGGNGADCRVVECPALGHWWQQALAVRRLGSGDALEAPALIHVLPTRMSAVGLALAERWRVPYLQTVDDFLAPDDRLRVSRRWCRGLIVPSRDLADDLVGNLGVPRSFLSMVRPGIEIDENHGSLPPCGGGPGWGVGRTEGLDRTRDLSPASFAPPTLTLPHKGGGNQKTLPSEHKGGGDQKIPPSESALPQSRTVRVIGTAGPLVEASGFATFLNAARRVLDMGVDAEFVIAGRGEDEGDLRRRAERLRIAERVTFAGVPVVGLRFWNVLDVFCQPATVPSVGRTLATALAFGVPSVASDIGGLKSLVTHDVTGLRVPSENSGALADAVLALLQDPGRARRLALQGQAAVRRDFDPEAEAEGLAAAYRRVLGMNAREPRVFA